MVRLTVEKGEAAGAVFELKAGEHTLGRSRASAVHLAAPDVSGVHACIRVSADGTARLENLSQFGTRINGVPVTGEQALADGQRLEFGKVTVLRVALDAAPTAAETEARTGEGGLTMTAAPAGAPRTGAASATRPPATRGAPRTGAADSELTGAFSRPDLPEAEEEGATHAMQTRVATPEEIELLKANEQKRARRHLLIGLAVAIPALILVVVFRPRTPPPENELEWSKDAQGEYLDAFEPALSGGFKEGGYDLMYPGNKTFKKSVADGVIVLEGWIGRNLDVPMRVILQEENEPRLAALPRAEMVADWIRQASASGGRWNFDSPSPVIAFFGRKNGVPYTRVTYLRDGDGTWFGTANVLRHGCRRIVARAEVPATERVRAERLLSAKLIRGSDEFEFAHWEYNPLGAGFVEAEALAQARKDLERMAPATWVALENLLTGLLTQAVATGRKETEAEALRLLIKLRERQALWFNSQQLAFDAARMQGNHVKAMKIEEFTKAVFSSTEDQRYFSVRKWKAVGEVR
jgi:hypothetical protein